MPFSIPIHKPGSRFRKFGRVSHRLPNRDRKGAAARAQCGPLLAGRGSEGRPTQPSETSRPPRQTQTPNHPKT